MEESLAFNTNQLCTVRQVLTISREVFNAMNPYSQAAALALEKIGKVRIVNRDEFESVGESVDS